jgi:alkanesulfonate monooxygenase SsuD/methylene tetrahydromethanopterin reductase-like flavin-dependent oxidoreductase (luciferase family)
MNTSMPIRRGLGITAGLDAGLARDLAVRCEHLGYHSLWSNDEPASAGLETLAHFAAAAPQLELGVGVLPLDRHQPLRIAAEITRLGLDPATLWVGVGSGQLLAPIHIMQRAVAELRELLPEPTRIVVAAMRPQMCQLGGAIADGVLLNWMLPAQAAQARGWVQQGAHQAGRAAPVVASYVRVAVGLGSRPRLRGEESHYRNINAAPSPALRGHGRSPRQRRRGRIDATGGARRTGAVPLRARPSDRTAAHSPGSNLAARRRGCRGPVSAAHPPGPGPWQSRALHPMPDHACHWSLAPGLDQRGRGPLGTSWVIGAMGRSMTLPTLLQS